MLSGMSQDSTGHLEHATNRPPLKLDIHDRAGLAAKLGA